MTGLQVQAPGGGRLFLDRVDVRPRAWTLLARGRWETRWGLGEIRMDPVSWGIRKPLAREILSAVPVTSGGFARVAFERGQMTLQELALHGPLLRLQAEGSLTGRWEAELALEGELRRSLLESMEAELPDPPEPWEPFELRVRGALASPEIRFTSHFFTFSMGSLGEKQP